MPSIHVNGSAYAVEPNETVLECLDRHGVAVMSSCRVGVCQSCMVRAVDSQPPAAAQKGLRDTVAAQGFFLACSARIETDITLDMDGVSGREVSARVCAIDRLNERVVRLRCEPDEPVGYTAGQFMNLIGPDGSVRSYSVASVPADPYLEFHVMLMPGGKVSTWVHNELRAGDDLPLVGPQGACFYSPGRADQPLLLAGTGTGLAPLFGILRDALAQQHTGPIHLFQGSVRSDGLYLVNELRALAAEHENVHYHPCALEPGGDDQTVVIKPIDAYIEQQFPGLEGYRAFLCGHPDLVKKLQRQTFLAGADIDDIYADAFIPAANS